MPRELLLLPVEAAVDCASDEGLVFGGCKVQILEYDEEVIPVDPLVQVEFQLEQSLV